MMLPLALVLLATAAAAEDDSRLEDGYALTLSGGVSLGSYEAGLNWTLVRLFRARMEEMLLRRRPRLVGVTGASAGSINALLVAALYCETTNWKHSMPPRARPKSPPPGPASTTIC